ncbi:AAA domain-containing protein [Actinokineospora inagensis]|uniref:AAA domain-containing protein n=1 Tax=Actinokineospora inagensis TaxID=103730 RepID=UPI0003FAB620|nr:AAA domain-containing protein [Actinokineospora inagensis]
MTTSGGNRLDVVRRKAAQWADGLIDFGHRNTLLHYKDTKTMTLDLTAANPEALTQLLTGRRTRLSALLPAKADHAAACARARSLSRTMVAMEEEQGVEAGRLARGLLRVAAPTTRGTSPVLPLRAPLLLQSLTLEPRTAAETDYAIELDDVVEVNPVLFYALNRQFGVDLDVDPLIEQLNSLLEDTADPAVQAAEVHKVLTGLLGAQNLAPELEDRVLAGLFSYEKLPMVRDLRNAGDLLANHDVIAAAAGFAPAIDALQGSSAGHRRVSPDVVSPRDEYLVLDADSSQQHAIHAVLSGQHTVIQGPPGTGKSQTIANIIAWCAAEGKRVLFVTEKRAAIEAVTDRLARVNLHHLVFDLHEQKLNRRQVAEQVAQSLELASQQLPAQVDDLHGHLSRRRSQVIEHVTELHTRRDPWEVSAYHVYNALLELPANSGNPIRFRGKQLWDLNWNTLRHVESDLTRFIDMGGLAVRRGESAWSRSEVRDQRAVGEVLAKLDSLAGQTWQSTQTQLRDLVGRAGLARPFDLAGWQEVLSLLSAVDRTVTTFGDSAFGPDLPALLFATGDKAWRKAAPAPIGWWQRRTLRKQAFAMRRTGKCDLPTLHRELLAAQGQTRRWQQLSYANTGPASMLGLGSAMERFTQLRDQLAAVAMCARLEEPDRWPEEKVTTTLDELNRDRDTLFRMPELNTIMDRFTGLGLDRFVAELAGRRAGADEAVAALRFSWYSSLLDEFRMRVPHLAQFTGAQHARVVDEFRQADANHLELNAQRVRRRVAEHLRAARDANPQQNTVVLNEAKRKRGHLPIRKLVSRAPDVLLAARPCWAMSPIVVSRLLPAEQLFDLVIFDEASQVEPYDAMASIMRGRQLVVAGDERQLPPTTFFRSALLGGGAEDEDAEEDTDFTPQLGDFESILKCLAAFIPQSHTLTWHYRSADERLIAFSNHEIYEDALVTFPGRDADSPLRLEHVDGVAAPGAGGVVEAEVVRVIDLILDHVRDKPDETLGVITMGLTHANRIEGAVRQAARQHPELEQYTSRMQGPGKRLFVKSLERVQGDERDAIILSIGYSKGADGRLPMRFGPLNQEGGERRLNVAVTRAKRRMTVVSSFTHNDMQAVAPTLGPQLLRRFLEFAANGGRPQDLGRARPQELNGFERSVAAALAEAGVPYVAQWGVSGYRIDFALGHPQEPGRMVLALEADGDTYHRSESARDRDRLRQDHLERLGWRFHRVWASEWFSKREAQIAEVLHHWKVAVVESERVPDPHIADEPVRAPETRTPTVVRGRRPPVPRRGKIDDYDERELVAVCGWLLSDNLLLDREARLDQAIRELGFTRRGRKIVERVSAAMDLAQQHTDQETR